METRGRVSELEREAAAVTTLQAVPVDVTPPDVLSEDEAAEWRNVCTHMPRGWYRPEYQGVLIAYCRQVVRGELFNDLAAEQERETDEGLNKYLKLTKAAERADRAADKFATTLRITPQSRYDAQKAARDSNKASNQRPW